MPRKPKTADPAAADTPVTSAADTAPSIRDRILELRKVPASSLVPNPKNWREHTDTQRRLFHDVLAEIGLAGVELVRVAEDGRLILLDGHMRQEELGDALVSVVVTDITEAEEDTFLATFDPLGRLITANEERTQEMIARLQAQNKTATATLLAQAAGNMESTLAMIRELDGVRATGFLDAVLNPDGGIQPAGIPDGWDEADGDADDADDYDDDDDEDVGDGASESGPYVNVSFAVTLAQRAIIHKALAAAKGKWGLPSSLEALVRLCDDFLAREQQ